MQTWMGAWGEIQRTKKHGSGEAQTTVESNFLQIWTQRDLFFCFVKAGYPTWKPTPHPAFFTEVYSRRLVSTIINRKTNQGETAPQQIFILSEYYPWRFGTVSSVISTQLGADTSPDRDERHTMPTSNPPSKESTASASDGLAL